MRRINHLFDQVCTWPNLHSAWRKAKSGSRKNRESAAFAYHLETELIQLLQSLKDQQWQPAPFRCFEIYDPKQRTIAVAPFRDRVVHHALVNVLEPIWEARFIKDSFATRKEKGVHKAVAQAQVYLRQNQWFLKTDVEKFFDSVDHDTLIRIIARTIKCKATLALCDTLVRNAGANGHGLPIGNRTSQFFANVYLHQLDLYIKQTLRVQHYVRYMDDFVLFSDDKTQLLLWKALVEQFLHDTLHLMLKPTATTLNHRNHGLSFLGTRIFTGLIRLRNQNLRRITKRIRAKEHLYYTGRLTEVHFLQSMNSYWAMLAYYPLDGLRRDLLSPPT
jgi:RNA-directed DNA polymerase